jgi:hypothetical protein
LRATFHYVIGKNMHILIRVVRKSARWRASGFILQLPEPESHDPEAAGYIAKLWKLLNVLLDCAASARFRESLKTMLWRCAAKRVITISTIERASTVDDSIKLLSTASFDWFRRTPFSFYLRPAVSSQHDYISGTCPIRSRNFGSYHQISRGNWPYYNVTWRQLWMNQNAYNRGNKQSSKTTAYFKQNVVWHRPEECERYIDQTSDPSLYSFGCFQKL